MHVLQFLVIRNSYFLFLLSVATPVVKKELLVPHGKREEYNHFISVEPDELLLWTNEKGRPLPTYYDGAECSMGCQRFINDRSSSILIITEHTKPELIFLFESSINGTVVNITLQRGKLS